MAYVTLDSIEEETGTEYTDDSKPTKDEAVLIIDGVAAEIDAALAEGGYALPVPTSATNSIALLRQYNRYGAAYRIWDAERKGTVDMTVVERWREDYFRFIDRLEKGKALPDLSQSGEGGPTKAKMRIW